MWTAVWLMWGYGVIMSFTFLSYNKVGCGLLIGYIPWFICLVLAMRLN